MNEEWRAVVGYEGYYEVNNFGQVRSIDREVPHGRHGLVKVKGRIMRQRLSRKIHGYQSITLSKQQ